MREQNPESVDLIFWSAHLHAKLGNRAEALDLLESRLKTAAGPSLRTELRLDPAVDGLRGNPRFEGLLVEPKSVIGDTGKMFVHLACAG